MPVRKVPDRVCRRALPEAARVAGAAKAAQGANAARSHDFLYGGDGLPK